MADPHVLDADGRRAELAANLADVTQRVADACAAVGRDPASVTTIAITKTFPASDTRLLAGLGVTDVGENRDQDARAKHDACADLGLRWHFVGQLQRNKARSVAAYADVVHSVDRLELVDALRAGAARAGRVVEALVQVDLDPDPDGDGVARGGAAPARVAELAAAIDEAEGLQLGGVMAVAPLGVPAEPAFMRLAEVSARLVERHPQARIISAGMTGDLEAAIAAGATHLRIGTALLGRRTAPLG